MIPALPSFFFEGNVLGSLTNLVHKSLVVVDFVLGQETRYELHEMIRQYGIGESFCVARSGSSFSGIIGQRSRHCLRFFLKAMCWDR